MLGRIRPTHLPIESGVDQRDASDRLAGSNGILARIPLWYALCVRAGVTSAKVYVPLKLLLAELASLVARSRPPNFMKCLP